MKMRQVIKCEEKKMASLDVSIACVNLGKKPTCFPKELENILGQIQM